MITGNEALLLRFPQYRESITKQFEQNEYFAALCLDYQLCVSTIEEIKKGNPGDSENIREYQELKKELEEEATKYFL